MIGTKVENYRITSVLGEGGMGVVYKAFDLKLERYVALKILNKKATSNPQFVERFKREAKNQAQLSHPNIVPVYGFADDHNLLGFVMEYVNGETLEHRIEKNGRLHLVEALEVMKQILGGAAYAHSRGFIHRDLKPSNIIFTQDGIAKIMDFGISKSINESKGITKSGVKIGTLLYMSPEQIKAYEPTVQSDIYSLGIIFYEMLIGKNPFDGKSDFQIMEAHLKKLPPRISTFIPDMPEEIDRIIFKAIAKSTEKRYKDALEFYEDIDQELVRLKSEQRKTKEVLVKKQQNKITWTRITNYLMIAGGILFSAVIIYLAYNALEKYFVSYPEKTDRNTITIYESSPFKFVNSGWNKVAAPVSESFTGIKFSGNTGVITGFNGTLLVSGDAGQSWSLYNSGSSDNFYSITDLENNIFLITGENGIIYKFNSHDRTIRKIASGVNLSLFDSFFLQNNKTGFICGSRGTILKTTDGGENWKEIRTGSRKLLYSIYFIDNNKGFSAGWDGEFLVTSDGGETWHRTSEFSSNYLKDIYFLNKETGFVIGGEGEIYKTTDSGNSWKQVNSGISSGLYFIRFINDKNGYILGSKGEILYSDDAGYSWRVSQTGSHTSLTDIVQTSDNSLFITGYNGTLLVSR